MVFEVVCFYMLIVHLFFLGHLDLIKKGNGLLTEVDKRAFYDGKVVWKK